MPDRSLPRSERLRSLGALRRLFEEGESGFVFPFRYVWLTEQTGCGREEQNAEPAAGSSVEVLFSVPKKFHKRANKRNLLRRRTKEAYRLQKTILTAAKRSSGLDLALIYSSKEILSYNRIEHAVRRILETIAGQM